MADTQRCYWAVSHSLLCLSTQQHRAHSHSIEVKKKDAEGSRFKRRWLIFVSFILSVFCSELRYLSDTVINPSPAFWPRSHPLRNALKPNANLGLSLVIYRGNRVFLTFFYASFLIHTFLLMFSPIKAPVYDRVRVFECVCVLPSYWGPRWWSWSWGDQWRRRPDAHVRKLGESKPLQKPQESIYKNLKSTNATNKSKWNKWVQKNTNIDN